MSESNGRWTTPGSDFRSDDVEMQLEKLIESMAEKPDLSEIKDILTRTRKLISRYRAVSAETILTIELLKANDNKEIAQRLEKLHVECLHK